MTVRKLETSQEGREDDGLDQGGSSGIDEEQLDFRCILESALLEMLMDWMCSVRERDESRMTPRFFT